MVNLPLTGGCLCGGVRFEVTEPLVSASWCHCTRCQRRTGTPASIQARAVPGSLRILQGEELLRAWEPPEGFSKVFCSACGASMWSQSREDPEIVSIRFGAFDSDPGIRASFHQYVDYAAPWDTLLDDGLPCFPERRPPSV